MTNIVQKLNYKFISYYKNQFTLKLETGQLIRNEDDSIYKIHIEDEGIIEKITLDNGNFYFSLDGYDLEWEIL